MKPDAATHDRIEAPDAAIHVWRLDLDAAGESACKTLIPEEAARAERIRSAQQRRRWVAGRAGLRDVLAAYSGRAASELRFRYGEHGKPALLWEPGEPELRFNLSHSRELALVAVAVGRELGVDVEAVRTGRNIDAIAARLFSPREQVAFAAVPPKLRELTFYVAWSRKEAFVKARGDALWLVRDLFDVSLLPGEPARLLETRPDPTEAARWIVSDVDVGTQFAAALAFEGPGCPVLVRQWS